MPCECEHSNPLETRVTRYLVDKMGRDMAKAVATLGQEEVRSMVAAYYQMQRQRIRAGNQVRALSESRKPHEIFEWYSMNTYQLEKYIQKTLDYYTDSKATAKWAKGIRGVGTIIAAGLEAHVDIMEANKISALWAFAGLDPTRKWEKGQKRPWNAELKTLCWKIGESFVKVSGRPDSFYGKVYRERKELENERNEKGLFAEQAEQILTKKNFSKDTEAYKYYSGRWAIEPYVKELMEGHKIPTEHGYGSGSKGAARKMSREEATRVVLESGNVELRPKLPPAHIHARAKRYAVKIFLSHWHQVAYRYVHNAEPPLPWIIAHGGHTDFISVDEVNEFEANQAA